MVHCAPPQCVRARVPTAALFGVREILVRGHTPVKVKGAYATAAQGSRKTCGRQVGRVTSRSWRPGLGGSGTLWREHGAGLNTCVLDETLVAVIVDGDLVLVAALTCRRERGHRAFFRHHKTNATAFETTGETA